jgi:hypothetical protein
VANVRGARRPKRPRIDYDQAEAAAMARHIRRLEDAADDARHKAAALGVPAAVRVRCVPCC